MYKTLRVHSQSLRFLPATAPRDAITLCRKWLTPGLERPKNLFPGLNFSGKFEVLEAWTGEGSYKPEVVDDVPVSVELEPICSESQFDRVIAEVQQLEQSIIVVWMASWCRKCIYLKPKLEKLAADYYPRLRFYRVDVNNVPHKLVARAGVTLWKDGKKQAEVIGGHKAYLVINEVKEMIENEHTL